MAYQVTRQQQQLQGLVMSFLGPEADAINVEDLPGISRELPLLPLVNPHVTHVMTPYG